MDSLDININEIIKFIIDELDKLKIELTKGTNVRFHHNTSYKNAPLVCKYGILTLLDLNKIGLRNDTSETLEKLNDTESHINGNNGVSLARVGLKDLYDGENEYDPFDPRKVDFTLSDDVKAYRNSIHYGNEYISCKSIENDKILTIDVRILEYIDKCKSKEDLKELINMYNSLIDISQIINENDLDISMREMSGINNFSIDTIRLAKSKKIQFNRVSA